MITRRICPHCGAAHNAATQVGGEAEDPRPGDGAVCFDCGALLIYELEGFRYPTDEERAELLADPLVARARALILGRDLA